MIEILQSGWLSTVQDLGRAGRQHLGLSRGGAMDALALRRANLLVGNAEDAAGLEIVQGPLRLRLSGSGTLAVCGADFDAQLAGKALRPEWRAPFADGDELRLQAQVRSGARAVLAFAGGIDVPPVLGARGTDLAACFGGWQGRALRVGDRLPLAAAGLPRRRLGLAPQDELAVLRVLPGPEFDSHLDAGARAQLLATAWVAGAQSNRMGLRLQGARLALRDTRPLPSHAVCPGLIQLPPDGQPIVLGADAQATGGYARIAVVIAADLGLLGQWRIGQACRLQPVSPAQALAALQARADDLDTLRRRLAMVG